jgi:adenylate kinase family enzyme
MRLIIIGNIASGKTTLAKKLAEHYKIPILSIDDFREKYNISGDAFGENHAWDLFIHFIMQTDKCIVDTTGTSKHYFKMMTIVNGPKIIIKIDSNQAQCLKNYEKRKRSGYKMPPIPWKMDIKNSLHRNDTVLKLLDYDILHREIDETIALIDSMS